MIKVKSAAIGIDTEADYLKALELISSFGIKPLLHKESKKRINKK